MSIKQGIEIRELRKRVEKLEGFMNETSTTPRKVAGTPDVVAPKKPKKKVEV